jgi:DNA-binding winged helix-turn-helix (wHTH) protein
MALYSFGVFRFDTRTGEVRNAVGRTCLRPQPSRVLAYLVERRGECVSRDELRGVLWPDGTFVQFDHGLNSCIKQIRAALGDSRRSPRYVETLVKRGYRFVAPVQGAGRSAELVAGASIGQEQTS